MKRITALTIVLCLILTLFSCVKEPDSTDTVTARETEEVTTDKGSVPDETETETETETEQITETETETDAATGTEPAPENTETYDVYDPTFNAHEYKATLRLYENGKYSSEMKYTDGSSGINVYNSITEEGAYRVDESGADLELIPERISLTISFDNAENKETFLSSTKNTYLMGVIDGATYEIIKKAANGGFSGGAADVAESSWLGEMASTVTKAVLDREEKKAYYLLTDMTLSENEYYITENGYTLVLENDGSCRMYYEDLKRDEKDFGDCIVSDVYEGTYTQNGRQVSCTITGNTTKLSFLDETAKNSYTEYYEEQYSKGLIAKVYYDYYMALVSENGYTDDDMSDTYILELEEHTHTAIIIESPESEL